MLFKKQRREKWSDHNKTSRVLIYMLNVIELVLVESVSVPFVDGGRFDENTYNIILGYSIHWHVNDRLSKRRKREDFQKTFLEDSLLKRRRNGGYSSFDIKSLYNSSHALSNLRVTKQSTYRTLSRVFLTYLGYVKQKYNSY